MEEEAGDHLSSAPVLLPVEELDSPSATAKAKAVELIEIDDDDDDDDCADAVPVPRPAQKNVCASCTYVNSPTALVCAICDSALPQQQQQQQQQQHESKAPASAASSSSSSSNLVACRACTLLNLQTALVCQTCDEPLVEARAGAGGGSGNGRTCSRCSVILPDNHPEKTACTVCGFVPTGKSSGIKRKGNCFICKEAGHWSEDCPQNPNKKVAALVGDSVEGFNSYQVTDGLIELINTELSENSPSTVRYRLCSPCPHVTQTQADGAKWACGYRNIQMLLLSLNQIPAYRRVMFNGDGEIPCVNGMQSWIEKAWRAGFDEAGAADFGGVLLGTDDYIGTTECAALLRFFGIRAHVLAFESKSDSAKQIKHRGNYGESKRNAATAVTDTSKRVADWIKRYFVSTRGLPLKGPQGTAAGGIGAYYKPVAGAAAGAAGGAAGGGDPPGDGEIPASFLPPLYFQHDGHSRTIVGFEVNSTGKNSLLLFDPSTVGMKIKKSLQDFPRGKWQQSVKRGLATISRDAYEIVYVSGLMNKAEKERSKIMINTPEEYPIDHELPALEDVGDEAMPNSQDDEELRRALQASLADQRNNVGGGWEDDA